ncbi:MAG: hypothetical protein ACOYCE_07890 [Limnochordia bacterium]|jgi:hypothetical protein
MNMNVIPDEVLRQRRLRKIVDNAYADPVTCLIWARMRDVEDSGPRVKWESMTADQRECYEAGFWDALPVLRRFFQKEEEQWLQLLEAYMWLRGDVT